jgi:hypothetical protein
MFLSVRADTFLEHGDNEMDTVKAALPVNIREDRCPSVRVY